MAKKNSAAPKYWLFGIIGIVIVLILFGIFGTNINPKFTGQNVYGSIVIVSARYEPVTESIVITAENRGSSDSFQAFVTLDDGSKEGIVKNLDKMFPLEGGHTGSVRYSLKNININTVREITLLGKFYKGTDLIKGQRILLS